MRSSLLLWAASAVWRRESNVIKALGRKRYKPQLSPLSLSLFFSLNFFLTLELTLESRSESDIHGMKVVCGFDVFNGELINFSFVVFLFCR